MSSFCVLVRRTSYGSSLVIRAPMAKMATRSATVIVLRKTVRIAPICVLLLLSSASAAPTCPVDINTVRVDSLGPTCGNANRVDLCEACICDVGGRLMDAGYNVFDGSVPFQTCALQFASILQSNGATTAAMVKMLSCKGCARVPSS